MGTLRETRGVRRNERGKEKSQLGKHFILTIISTKKREREPTKEISTGGVPLGLTIISPP